MSLAFLVALLCTVQWREAVALLKEVRLPLLAAALLGYPAQIGLSTLKWHLLLHTQQISQPFGRLFRYYWIGSFASNLLPSSIGGDVLRIAFLRGTGRLPAVSASVFVERLTGFSMLLLLAFVALASRPDYFGGAALQPALWFLTAGLTSFALIVLACGDRLLGWLQALQPSANHRAGWCLSRLCALIAATLFYRRRPGAFAACLGLSLIFYAVRIAVLWLVAASLGLGLPFLDILAISPVVDLIWSVPVSFSGLGVVEGALVVFLGRAGLAPPEALAVAMLSRLLHLLATSVGGLLWVGAPRDAARGGA